MYNLKIGSSVFSLSFGLLKHKILNFDDIFFVLLLLVLSVSYLINHCQIQGYEGVSLKVTSFLG